MVAPAIVGQGVVGESVIGTTTAPPTGGTMSYSDSVLALPGLLAYWRLGEASGPSVTDASGNGHTGTISGATPGAAGLLAGDSDTAYAFTGAGGVLVPNDASFSAGAVTVLLMLKTPGDGGAGTRAVIGNGTWSVALQNVTTLGTWDGSWKTTGQNVADNVARHIAYVFDPGVSNGSAFWFDGVQVSSHTITALSAATDLAIGQHQSQTGQNLTGTIDEVAIVSGALDGATITALADAALTAPEPPPATVASGRVPLLQIGRHTRIGPLRVGGE